MAEPYGTHSNRRGHPDGERSDGERPGGRLAVRSVPVPDPGEDFLAQIPVPAAVAWVRQFAGLAGWGEAARVTLPAGADRFTAAEKWLRELADSAQVDDAVRRSGSGLVAFGTFTFDDTSDGSVLIVPRVVLGRDGTGNAWLTTVTPAGEASARGGRWAPVVGRPVPAAAAAGRHPLARRVAVGDGVGAGGRRGRPADQALSRPAEGRAGA
jgi:hypothetical protein